VVPFWTRDLARSAPAAMGLSQLGVVFDRSVGRADRDLGLRLSSREERKSSPA
jgi:hypothetical protein